MKQLNSINDWVSQITRVTVLSRRPATLYVVLEILGSFIPYVSCSGAAFESPNSLVVPHARLLGAELFVEVGQIQNLSFDRNLPSSPRGPAEWTSFAPAGSARM